MSSEFRNFLELSYEELEDLNLKAKDQRKKRVSAEIIQEERLELESEQDLRPQHDEAGLVEGEGNLVDQGGAHEVSRRPGRPGSS